MIQGRDSQWVLNNKITKGDIGAAFSRYKSSERCNGQGKSPCGQNNATKENTPEYLHESHTSKIDELSKEVKRLNNIIKILEEHVKSCEQIIEIQDKDFGSLSAEAQELKQELARLKKPTV